MKFSMDNWVIYLIVNFLLFCLIFFVLMNIILYPTINTEKIKFFQILVSGLLYSLIMTIYKFRIRSKIDNGGNK